MAEAFGLVVEVLGCESKEIQNIRALGPHLTVS
jgi:hypothetical protein